MRRIFIGLGSCILIVMLVSFVPVSATAQTHSVRRYKVDMKCDLDRMNLDPESPGSLDLNTYLVVFGFGYFINNVLEVGPEVSYMKYEEIVSIGGPEITNEISKSFLTIKGNAHFSINNRMNLYAGVRMGLSILDLGDTDDTAPAYGAQLGFDYFITQNVSINIEQRFTWASYEFYDEDTELGDANLTIGFGIFF